MFCLCNFVLAYIGAEISGKNELFEIGLFWNCFIYWSKETLGDIMLIFSLYGSCSFSMFSLLETKFSYREIFTLDFDGFSWTGHMTKDRKFLDFWWVVRGEYWDTELVFLFCHWLHHCIGEDFSVSLFLYYFLPISIFGVNL